MVKIFCAVLGMMMLATAALALGVGDQAPAVKVKKWAHGKGGNPAKADGKTVYVVEFWATWCGPCLTTIPHLNEFHDKYRGQGVIIMGITSEDLATVKKFMKTTPMKYNVGIDDQRATNAAYMKGIRGIPHAFVINRKGKVVWHGHPMSGLERILEQVVAGTFDPKKAKQVATLKNQFIALARQQKFEEMLTILNQIAKLDPGDPQNHNYKIELMKHMKKDAKDIAASYRTWRKACAKNASGLAEIANVILKESEPAFYDIELALLVARKAVKLTRGTDEAAIITLIMVYQELCCFDKAKAILKQGIAVRKRKSLKSPKLLKIRKFLNKIALVRKKLGQKP